MKEMADDQGLGKPYFLCGGHFVLEEQSLQVSVLIKNFFGRIYS